MSRQKQHFLFISSIFCNNFVKSYSYVLRRLIITIYSIIAPSEKEIPPEQKMKAAKITAETIPAKRIILSTFSGLQQLTAKNFRSCAPSREPIGRILNRAVNRFIAAATAFPVYNISKAAKRFPIQPAESIIIRGSVSARDISRDDIHIPAP